MSEHIIRAEEYTYSYADEKSLALHLRSFFVEKGELVLLVGASGSGKSTLLSRLAGLTGLRGEESGELHVDAKTHGFVWQEASAQMVCDRVEQEIVFGMESNGFPVEMMHRRLAELVTFFGLESLVHKEVFSLSEGEKQTVNIAGAMAMNPELLLLDEPVSCLDPVASERLVGFIEKIHRKLQTTIIIAEQRAEALLPIADRVVCIEAGEIVASVTPEEIDTLPTDTKEKVMEFLTEEMKKEVVPTERQEDEFEKKNRYEVTRQGTGDIEKNIIVEDKINKIIDEKDFFGKKKSTAVMVKNLYYRYEKKSDFVLKDLDLNLNYSEITCLVGGNGSGKSTLAKLICGLAKPDGGRVKIPSNKGQEFKQKEDKAWDKNDRKIVEKADRKYKIKNNKEKTISYLPPEPRYLFLENTIEDELKKSGEDVYSLCERLGLLDREREIDCDAMSNRTSEEKKSDIRKAFLARHPMDISTGERERLGIAITLAREAGIYVLDEPTRGLDPKGRRVLAELLSEKKKEGAAVLVITHDIELAAAVADRIAMMYDGRVVAEDEAEGFLSENIFYTDRAHRLTRGR